MPLYQDERVPLLFNGQTVYLRGSLEYDVNTGARISTKVRDVLTYADIVARSGLCLPVPTVSYTDVNGTKVLHPGDSILPLVGGAFTIR